MSEQSHLSHSKVLPHSPRLGAVTLLVILRRSESSTSHCSDLALHTPSQTSLSDGRAVLGLRAESQGTAHLKMCGSE